MRKCLNNIVVVVIVLCVCRFLLVDVFSGLVFESVIEGSVCLSNVKVVDSRCMLLICKVQFCYKDLYK